MTQAERDRLPTLKKAKEEADYAARGSRGAGDKYAPGEAVAVCVEEARRQGGDSRVAGKAVGAED
jgi:hypothetical protein